MVNVNNPNHMSKSLNMHANTGGNENHVGGEPDNKPVVEEPVVNKPVVEEQETKLETKPENKPETKLGNKPETKPETKPENKPENKPETKPDNNAGVTSNNIKSDKPVHRNTRGEMISLAKLELEKERCTPLDDDRTLPVGLLKYCLKHIRRSMIELILELKLLIIDDGSEAPSYIPFVTDRTGMDFMKERESVKAKGLIEIHRKNIPTIISLLDRIMTIDVINEVKQLNIKDDEFQEKLEKRHTYIETHIRYLSGRRMVVEKPQSNHVDEHTDQDKQSDTNQHIKDIIYEDTLLLGEIKKILKSKVIVVNKDGEKADIKTWVYIWDFIKYYKKNFIFTVLILYLVINLVIGSINRLSSADPEIKAKGISKLITGLILIYFLYTFARTLSIQPIFAALGVCIIWGLVGLIFYIGSTFYNIYKTENNTSLNRPIDAYCRGGIGVLPYENLTFTDVLLLIVSFSLLIFSCRQIGRLIEYKNSQSYIKNIMSVRLKEWVKSDWIIFKVLVVLYVILSISELNKNKAEHADPLLRVSNILFIVAVFIAFIQYLIGNKYLEQKPGIRTLKNIGDFAHRIKDIAGKNNNTSVANKANTNAAKSASKAAAKASKVAANAKAI